MSGRAAGGAAFNIHTDHLNTPRMIANQAGTAVWRWDQGEPFGSDVPNGDPNSTGVVFDFPLRFPGQYFDRETNLAYNNFRDYDPGIGRYVESDPIGLLGGENTYAYVDNNPIGSTDPMGLIGQLKKGKWAQCSREDWKFCERFCEPRRVLSCRHFWSLRTEVVGGEIVKGWKAAPEPSCNCDECPPKLPSPGPRGNDDPSDILMNGGDDPKPKPNPFGPLPMPRPFPVP